MKYIRVDVQENSDIYKKIEEIKEKTGINSDLNCVKFMILNYGDDKNEWNQ